MNLSHHKTNAKLIWTEALDTNLLDLRLKSTQIVKEKSQQWRFYYVEPK